VDTVDHVLDEHLLGSSESPLVGDIKGAIVGLSVFSVDTSDLHEVFISDFIEFFLLFHQFWKFDVNRGSQGCSEIGWARGDVTEMIVVGEFSYGLNVSASSAESVEDLHDSGTLLHGNNSELIFLIDPNVESFVSIVENTSSRWPLSVEVASFEESVTLLEENVVSDELVLVGFGHTFEWVEFTLEVFREGVASFYYIIHNLFSLLLGDTWSEGESVEVSSDSDSGGDDHCGVFLGEFSVLDAFGRHIRLMLISFFVTVIFLDDGIKEFIEFCV